MTTEDPTPDDPNSETAKPVSTPPRSQEGGLTALVREIGDWTVATFPSQTPASAVKHAEKEIAELLEDPSNGEEQADVVMLMIAAARSAGNDLEAELRRKLAINRSRTWGEPDADGVVEHLREGSQEDGGATACGACSHPSFSHITPPDSGPLCTDCRAQAPSNEAPERMFARVYHSFKPVEGSQERSETGGEWTRHLGNHWMGMPMAVWERSADNVVAKFYVPEAVEAEVARDAEERARAAECGARNGVPEDARFVCNKPLGHTGDHSDRHPFSGGSVSWPNRTDADWAGLVVEQRERAEVAEERATQAEGQLREALAKAEEMDFTDLGDGEPDPETLTGDLVLHLRRALSPSTEATPPPRDGAARWDDAERIENAIERMRMEQETRNATTDGEVSEHG